LLQYRCMERINIRIGLCTYVIIYNYVYLVPVQNFKYSIFDFIKIRIEEIRISEGCKLISYMHACRLFRVQLQQCSNIMEAK
jgi:hypothetical protein